MKCGVNDSGDDYGFSLSGINVQLVNQETVRLRRYFVRQDNFAGGQRIAVKQVGSGSTSYFHPDLLGSTNVLTNGSGVKEEDVVYYPYGETSTNTGTASVAYTYTGKELDTSTGLYFYEARDYDATLRRFISANTIVPNPTDPQAFNRYSYARNNPILFNDPSGHFFK